MSASKRNTAHHGFGRVMGASDRMNIRACRIPAMSAHAAGSVMARSCSAAVTTRWQQLLLATALRQAGSPPTSGSFDVLLRARDRDREGAILRG
jgi:hypothetical protein